MSADLFSPTVNFVLFSGALVYFLKKPVQTLVRERRENLLKQVEDARQQKEEAQKKLAEFETKLRSFESEAKNYLETAKQEAQVLKKKIIDDANASAERILKESESSLNAMVQEFKNEVRKQTVRDAIEQAEKLIQNSLSNEEQKRIITEYVGKV